jgi:hypothetical protein
VFQEIAIEVFQPKISRHALIATIIAQTDQHTGELRILVTGDGMGDGPFPIAIYPTRRRCNMVRWTGD